MLNEFIDKIGGNEDDLRLIKNKFNITMTELVKKLNEGDFYTFSNYTYFFIWMWSDLSSESILRKHLTNDLEPDTEQYIIMPNGVVVFMFI
jgi:hypothetical protein